MALVTLIGEKIADKGKEFVYIGPNNECRSCKLKTVCFNLKIGRRYKIIGVRDKKHNCNIHEGTAIVVEVEELPIITCIDKKYSKGAKTKIDKENCEHIGCENYEFCSLCIQKDKMYTITKIHNEVKCPIDLQLNKVELTDK